MAAKVKISDLKIEETLFIRSGYNEDAIQRYMELYNSTGKFKAIKVQAGTLVVIDGWHRIEAAKRLKVETIQADKIEVKDSDLRAKAYEYNKAHGVPLSREERNQLIGRLSLEDGKTPVQLAKLMGLSERWIREIISIGITSETNNSVPDQRRELTDEDIPIIARLLLGGETQEQVAETFGVTQPRISQVWSSFRDNVKKLYAEDRLLKREVAENVGLNVDEVDKILQEYGDPLNFEQMTGTWWPEFGLDDRFGKDHKSNLPADLVRNVLALYTKPGDVVLDPAAGGGVVIDVTKDMVNRKCYAYDLTPSRKDIKTYNARSGSPPNSPDKPDLVFLDLPYGPMKEYSADSEDLANLDIDDFLGDLSKIFSYWASGILVVLMASYRKDGKVTDLPYESEKRMIENGWKIIEHIVNNNGRVPSETGANKDSAEEYRWLMRKHIHIIVGEKT
uniref:Putative methyltransferase n=1 Tax=viral metagenome TaxID=1070528 RepID=A0A6M3M3Z8_9ZZZZ